MHGMSAMIIAKPAAERGVLVQPPAPPLAGVSKDREGHADSARRFSAVPVTPLSVAQREQ